MITIDTPILSPADADIARIIGALCRHDNGAYTPLDVQLITRAYVEQAAALGVNSLIAIGQMAHETGYLGSWWAARPRRNPAGLGVTGRWSLRLPPTGVWQQRAGIWREGLAFARWAGVGGAIDAHLGRLLAYALPPGGGTTAQQDARRRALSFRPLPARLLGAAPTLAGLGGTWAVPGRGYAGRIAAVANALR